MATTQDFIEYIYEQLSEVRGLSHRKMFGECMMYVNGKPLLLVCDNTVFVKKREETLALFEAFGYSAYEGIPYSGARPHYVLDIDEQEFAVEMLKLLDKILPFPKPKKKKPKGKI